MNAALLLAVATILFLGYVLTRLASWGLVAPRLSAYAEPLERWPSVSVVIAGCNEERNVAEALRSVLALDYPDLEIIFVNDRSTDRTGEIVRGIGSGDTRIKVVDIDDLPSGWLGKNHALQIGAERASGEFLLFTDADVIFDQRVLRLAIACMERLAIDHLTSGFTVTAPTLRLRLFVAGFMLFFMFYARPWAVRNPRSTAHVGVGGVQSRSCRALSTRRGSSADRDAAG